MTLIKLTMVLKKLEKMKQTDKSGGQKKLSLPLIVNLACVYIKRVKKHKLSMNERNLGLCL